MAAQEFKPWETRVLAPGTYRINVVTGDAPFVLRPEAKNKRLESGTLTLTEDTRLLPDAHSLVVIEEVPA